MINCATLCSLFFVWFMVVSTDLFLLRECSWTHATPYSFGTQVPTKYRMWPWTEYRSLPVTVYICQGEPFQQSSTHTRNTEKRCYCVFHSLDVSWRVYVSGICDGNCSLCPAGKFKSEIGEQPCQNCTSGTYSSTNGASVCSQCPSRSNSKPGSSVSSACMCNAGWTGPTGGNCTLCVAGTYKLYQGNATCTNCSAGQFSTAVGATSDVCQGCPTNSNAPEASDEEVDCTSTVGCLPGFTKKEDHWWDPCVNCERGKYKSFRGSGPCNECPEHASTEAPSQRNSTSINDCECLPGFFGSAGVCKICPVDTYKEELGNFVCVECPLHTASPQGSTTNQMCTCKQNFLLSEVFACACCVGVYGLACVFVFAWACVCVFVRACMYTCWYVHERKCLYMHTAQTCTCMQLTQDTICRSLCLYVYIYVHGAFHHTHTHTHIYIHTHKLSQTHINYERIKPHLLHHWSCWS